MVEADKSGGWCLRTMLAHWHNVWRHLRTHHELAPVIKCAREKVEH